MDIGKHYSLTTIAIITTIIMITISITIIMITSTHAPFLQRSGNNGRTKLSTVTVGKNCWRKPRPRFRAAHPHFSSLPPPPFSRGSGAKPQKNMLHPELDEHQVLAVPEVYGSSNFGGVTTVYFSGLQRKPWLMNLLDWSNRPPQSTDN